MQRSITSNVALVSNVLSKYRVACFRKLLELMRGRVNFYFLAKTMEHRSVVISSKYPEINGLWLKGWKWHSPPQDDRHLNNILPVIKQHHDIIILGAWDEPSYLLLWLWGIFCGKKVIFWIESTLGESHRQWLKEGYKKLLFKKASGCIVPGLKSFEYCRVLGMAPDKIFFAPNATDRAFFRSRADQFLPQRQELREELGLAGVTILFVGRFVDAYKNVSLLIRAVARLKSAAKEINLVLVGDGPDRAKYEKLVKQAAVSGARFLGEMGHEQLCRVYAASDIMVLPSRSEAWGFVLNEAMEFGLPLVVTDAVGAGPDLVRPGENGFIVPSGDEGELVKALEKLSNDPGLRTRMGEASRRIVEHFSPENWAAGVVSAIKAVSREAR